MNTNRRLWILKSVTDNVRSYTSINGYEDNISEKYEYDNFVANNKQIKEGDWGIIIDKNKILGFLKIDKITTSSKQKERRRCPVQGCGSTNYETRKNKRPIYRCNQGHEFDIWISETFDATSYIANYKNNFISANNNFDISQLRPYYNKGYNRNMSIQSFDFRFFDDYFQDIPSLLSDQHVHYLISTEADTSLDDPAGYYTPNNEDLRKTIERQIKERRGQKNFRNDLIRIYESQCVITGCKLLDILEAAHIKPYRGENDNHVSNGLLLRSDIHTLFDLNLIAIHPDTLIIHVCKTIQVDAIYRLLNKTHLILPNSIVRPSQQALRFRWNEFLRREQV